MNIYELLIEIDSPVTGYALPVALPEGTTEATADEIARLYLGDSYPKHLAVHITRRISRAGLPVTLRTITRAKRDVVERAPDPIKPEPPTGGARSGSLRFIDPFDA